MVVGLLFGKPTMFLVYDLIDYEEPKIIPSKIIPFPGLPRPTISLIMS
jgi:hypothetical protein